MARIGRNVPCPCGSGKKYKKCCAEALQAPQPSMRLSPTGSAAHPPELQKALDWHRCDNLWSAEILEWVRQTDPDRVDEVCNLLSQDVLASAGDISGFVDQYLIWHSELEPDRSTALSYIFASGPHKLVGRTGWCDAQMQSWLGLWQIQLVEPGRGFHMIDLLTGQERYVFERKGSRVWKPLEVCLARVVEVGEGVFVLAGAYPQALPSHAAREVRQNFMNYAFPRRKKLKPADLRSGMKCLLLYKAWVLQLALMYPDSPRAPVPEATDYFSAQEIDEILAKLDLK